MNRTNLLFLIFFICCTLHVISGEQKNGNPEGDLSFQNKLKIINQAISVGDYSTALNLASEGLEAAEMERDQKKAFHCHIKLSAINRSIGNYDQAIVSYNWIVNYNDHNNSSDIKLRSLVELGHLYMAKGNFSQSLNYYRLAMVAGNENNHDNKIVAEIAHAIGMIFEKIKDYDNALKFHSYSLYLQRRIGNNLLEVKVLSHMANCYFYTNDVASYISTLKHIYKSTLRSKRIVDFIIYFRAYGDFYMRYHMFDLALLHYDKAVRTAYLNHDYGSASIVLTRIAHLYTLQDQFELAIDFNSQALYNRQLIKSDMLVASSLLNIGTNYLNICNFETARQFYLEALELSYKLKSDEYINESIDKLLDYSILVNDRSQAIYYKKKLFERKDSLFNKNSNNEINNYLHSNEIIAMIEKDVTSTSYFKVLIALSSLVVFFAIIFILFLIILKQYSLTPIFNHNSY